MFVVTLLTIILPSITMSKLIVIRWNHSPNIRQREGEREKERERGRDLESFAWHSHTTMGLHSLQQNKLQENEMLPGDAIPHCYCRASARSRLTTCGEYSSLGTGDRVSPSHTARTVETKIVRIELATY